MSKDAEMWQWRSKLLTCQWNMSPCRRSHQDASCLPHPAPKSSFSELTCSAFLRIPVTAIKNRDPASEVSWKSIRGCRWMIYSLSRYCTDLYWSVSACAKARAPPEASRKRKMEMDQGFVEAHGPAGSFCWASKPANPTVLPWYWRPPWLTLHDPASNFSN